MGPGLVSWSGSGSDLRVGGVEWTRSGTGGETREPPESQHTMIILYNCNLIMVLFKTHVHLTHCDTIRAFPEPG